ncbi:MAG: serine/threonine protein kinase, partial [Verrucomicrobiales bacterium]|nr:serine/threonine protein kinase [Verrucomicrobiales bacterium]
MSSTHADTQTGGPDSAPGRCRRCGRPLPTHVLAGHCGRCLVETSFGADDSGIASESSFDDHEPLPRRLGDYELIEVIGRGGMGVVYRARQSSLERDVALKLLPGGEFARPDFLKRFRREALAAARLRHPNIVAIHDGGEHDGVAFYSMELVAGRTLAEILADGPLSARRAAEYLREIARAVGHAHEAGILHRDLKPANVLIDRATERPRVTDFGLAKSVRDDAPSETDAKHPGSRGSAGLSAPDDPRLTITGQALGSPSYMPPEQALGPRAEVGPSGDVYSLGAILYHMVTGRPPFEGVGIHDVLLQVRDNDPIPPRRLNARVPADLETICLKCLAKEPSRRYASAEALAADLDRFLEGRPILARPVGAVRRLGLWCRRRPVVAALSAGVLLLLLIVAVGASIAVLHVAAARRAEHAERLKTETANAELLRANRRLGETIQLLELQRIEDSFRAGDSPGAVARLAALLRKDRSNR